MSHDLIEIERQSLYNSIQYKCKTCNIYYEEHRIYGYKYIDEFYALMLSEYDMREFGTVLFNTDKILTINEVQELYKVQMISKRDFSCPRVIQAKEYCIPRIQNSFSKNGHNYTLKDRGLECTKCCAVLRFYTTYFSDTSTDKLNHLSLRKGCFFRADQKSTTHQGQDFSCDETLMLRALE